MTTLERREKCQQNRLDKWHFRPLGARQTRSRLLPAPLETLGPKPAKPLPMNAVQSIERVGIGESKRKSQFIYTVSEAGDIMTQFTSETVDDSRVVGGQSCLALDKDGNPHIAYATLLGDGAGSNVMYAYKNAGAWSLEKLPQGTFVEHSNQNRVALAIDSQGNPQVAYMQKDSRQLFHAVKRDNGWTFTLVPTGDLVNFQAVDGFSFQLDPGRFNPEAKDTPHFAFHDYSRTALGYTTMVAGTLKPTLVEDRGRENINAEEMDFDTGLDPSLAFDFGEGLRIAYFEQDKSHSRIIQRLRAAQLTYDLAGNQIWTTGVLDLDFNFARSASLASHTHGTICIAYYDFYNSTLKAFINDNMAEPRKEIVASEILNSSLLPSAAVNIWEQCRIAYEDDNKLKLASRDKFGQWTVEIVDPAGGAMPSLAYDKRGNAHIAYTIGATLKCATWTELAAL
jgi:hypothetical protein